MYRLTAILLALSATASASVVNVHTAPGNAVHEVPPTGLHWTIGYLDRETRMDVLPVMVPSGCELTAQIDVVGDPRSAWVRVDTADEGRWTLREPSRRVRVRNRDAAPMRAELVVAAFGDNRSRVDTRLSLRCHL